MTLAEKTDDKFIYADRVLNDHRRIRHWLCEADRYLSVEGGTRNFATPIHYDWGFSVEVAEEVWLPHWMLASD